MLELFVYQYLWDLNIVPMKLLERPPDLLTLPAEGPQIPVHAHKFHLLNMKMGQKIRKSRLEFFFDLTILLLFYLDLRFFFFSMLLLSAKEKSVPAGIPTMVPILT